LSPQQQTQELPAADTDPSPRLAGLSGALTPIFRGRFCDVLLPNRQPRTFARDEVLYDLGDRSRTLYFIRVGTVKVGTITESGREIIYDIRKDGDVVGELCAVEPVRLDRAVALEETRAIAVTFEEVAASIAAHPKLLGDLMAVLGGALAEAYEQVSRLAGDSVEHGLIKVLKTLAHKHGRSAGEFVEITTYLTQEELAQMVVARRERVSTALNVLRRRGIARYSARGHLLLDMRALENYSIAAK
jgi:CRP-like cAMP-binding protein